MSKKVKEIWKEVKGFEGFYEVSNLGRVRSLDRMVLIQKKGRNPYYISCKGIMMKCTIGTNGYREVPLRKGENRFLVHRLVAQAFIENPDNLPNVNHIDNNKLNNNVENLEWVTQSRNCYHAFDVGANKHGIEHHNSKFSEEQVRDIKKLLEKGELSQRAIARMYEVSQTTIRMIAIGKNWRRLSN